MQFILGAGSVLACAAVAIKSSESTRVGAGIVGRGDSLKHSPPCVLVSQYLCACVCVVWIRVEGGVAAVLFAELTAVVLGCQSRRLAGHFVRLRRPVQRLLQHPGDE